MAMSPARITDLLVVLAVAVVASGCTAMVEKAAELQVSQDMAYAKAYCKASGYGPDNPDSPQCIAAVFDYRGQQRGIPSARQSGAQVPGADGLAGTPMYPASDCIGAVVNGVCHGSILHPGAAPKRCYGSVLNGQCIGPEF